MKINFRMWGRALSSLVKMDKKEEWDALDVISKWLIATRSAVTAVTLYACVIAGLLAWRDGHFAWAPFLVVSLGLFIAHGANNLLNDYTDFTRGVDVDNYFRTQYGVHPLVQGFWTKRRQVAWFLVSGALAFASGVYALFYTDFSPVIIGLFAFGAVILLLYTWPLKYLGLGELMIFLIWGPVLVAGVYLVLTGGVWTEDVWNVALVGVPFGLSVVSINIGKHIDKSAADREKGVGTLPVRIGEKAARFVNMAVLVLIYLVILYLVFVPQFFTPVMLIVLLAVKRLALAIGVHTRPRPVEPPKEWPAWPTWFSGFAFYHNRLFGGLLILGLIADTLLRVFLPAFWPAR
ncbi:MAG: 1 4-dihydroxy-2-naphthoate octaprenyltransferase [Anaerolineaceae bacterium]|nr:MAG: 1 4-dihydroxy-2-naphthoate octaprenyltransferase [Anaerolineaceae bacterium]